MRQSFVLIVLTLSSLVAAFAPPFHTSVQPSLALPTNAFILHATTAGEDRVKNEIQPKRITSTSGNEPNQKNVSSSLGHSTDNESNSKVIDNLLAATNQLVDRFLSAGGGDDPIGTRGESYFFLQAFLIVSIALGGIPLWSSYLLFFAGPGLLAVGTTVLVMTAMDMGESITPWPKPNGRGLVQTGLYGIVRHPMYFGLLATVTGFSIATASMDRLLLTLLLYVAIEAKTEYEEEELKKAYPGEYEAYQRKVPNKFVPKGLTDLRKREEQEKTHE